MGGGGCWLVVSFYFLFLTKNSSITNTIVNMNVLRHKEEEKEDDDEEKERIKERKPSTLECTVIIVILLG